MNFNTGHKQIHFNPNVVTHQYHHKISGNNDRLVLKKEKRDTKNNNKTSNTIMRDAILRRYRTEKMYRKNRFVGMRASDMMYGQTKSLDRNIYAQIFSNGSFSDEIYPIYRKANSGVSLKTFITELQVPECLTVYVSKDQNAPGREFMKSCRRNDIQVTRTEP